MDLTEQFYQLAKDGLRYNKPDGLDRALFFSLPKITEDIINQIDLTEQLCQLA